jgi:hypothetical protein
VGSKDIDRLDVCVNGIPRHITDTLGFADSVEVYPARSFGCVDG